MKKTLIIILMLITLVVIVYSETRPPQIAYRILDDFIHDKEIHAAKSKKTSAYISMGLGIALMGVSGGLYFWGDELMAGISDEAAEAWSPTTRDITCLSLAGGGLATLVTGSLILFSPPKDYRSEFDYIYTEGDPVVQEALAAAALFDIAEKGKRDRITSGIIDLASPVLTLAIAITINLVQERPWYEDTTSTFTGLSLNLVSGFSKLFMHKSDEERLYERYQNAKQALLVAGDPNVALLN